LRYNFCGKMLSHGDCQRVRNIFAFGPPRIQAPGSGARYFGSDSSDGVAVLVPDYDRKVELVDANCSDVAETRERISPNYQKAAAAKTQSGRSPHSVCGCKPAAGRDRGAKKNGILLGQKLASRKSGPHNQ